MALAATLPEPTLVRIGVVARLFEKSTATIRRRVERGELPAIRTRDGEFLFDMAAVEPLVPRKEPACL